MYNKLFTCILDSTIWLLPDTTRIVWITLLAAMDQDGFARFPSVANLAHRAHVSLASAEEAVKALESPDPQGLDQPHEGRRIERVPYGWMVLNGPKYRDMANAVVARERNRLRVAEHRAKSRGGVTDRNGVKRSVAKSAPSEAEAEAEAETDTDETAAQSPEPASRASDRRPSKPREPDPIWDVVVDRWYGGGKSLTKSQRGAANTVVRDLKELGATPEEIVVRADRIAAAWSESSCTAHSLVKHWHQFATDPKPRTQGAANGIHARDARRAEIASRNCPDPRGERPIPFITID